MSNTHSRPERRQFWGMMIAQTMPESVLEVGCGDGLNLEQIRGPRLYGVDTYAPSLELARQRDASAVLSVADARDLRQFWGPSIDLVFTCTTLQHIADDEECRAAIRELIRVSRKWVLVMEYAADVRTPILWRGNPEGIVKRPWGKMLEREGLAVEGTGLLTRADGFDDVTWYLAKRPNSVSWPMPRCSAERSDWTDPPAEQWEAIPELGHALTHR